MVQIYEAKFYEVGYKAGLGDQQINELGRQFQITHPDEWETVFLARLQAEADRQTPEEQKKRLEKANISRKMKKALQLLHRLDLSGQAVPEKLLDKVIEAAEPLVGTADDVAIVGEKRNPVPDLNRLKAEE